MHPRHAGELDFDDTNEGHLARHHISLTEVGEVWLGGPVFVPNKRGMAALWLMLGDTAAGRSLTVAVEVDEVRQALRPITGWESTDAELSRWRAKGGG